MPFDLYWIYKRESKADYQGTTLEGRRFHTWGALFRPQYTETLSSEFEGAYQAGERDGGASVHGYMVFAALKYAPAVEWRAKPYIKPGFYYLSGDTDRSQSHGDSGWNAVWARYPQMSPLACFTMKDGVGYWTNLIYPHAATNFLPLISANRYGYFIPASGFSLRNSYTRTSRGVVNHLKFPYLMISKYLKPPFFR